MRVPEGVEKVKLEESVFKSMTENFPNLEGEMNIQIHESSGTPNRLNIKRSSRDTLESNFQKPKTKRILKAA